MKMTTVLINNQRVEVVKTEEGYVAAIGHVLASMSSYSGNALYMAEKVGAKAVMLSITRPKYYTDAEGVRLLVDLFNTTPQLQRLATALETGKGFKKLNGEKKEKKKKAKIKAGQLLLIDSDGTERIFTEET